MIHLKKFFKSFHFAFKGLTTAFKEEQNFRFQLFIVVLIILSSIYFSLDLWEIIILILTVVFVLVLELINSIFERIADAMRPRLDPDMRQIKDMMSAAVLISSLGALVVGILIFLPHFIEKFDIL